MVENVAIVVSSLPIRRPAIPFQRDMLYNVSEGIIVNTISTYNSLNNSIENNSSDSAGQEEEEEGESFLGLGWGQVEWAVLILGIGTTVAAISWMVR